LPDTPSLACLLLDPAINHHHFPSPRPLTRSLLDLAFTCLEASAVLSDAHFRLLSFSPRVQWHFSEQAFFTLRDVSPCRVLCLPSLTSSSTSCCFY
jgi:hypothetical protein